jgi:hypothetical protein
MAKSSKKVEEAQTLQTPEQQDLRYTGLSIVSLGDDTYGLVVLKFDHTTGTAKVEQIEEFKSRPRAEHEFRLAVLKHKIMERS